MSVVFTAEIIILHIIWREKIRIMISHCMRCLGRTISLSDSEKKGICEQQASLNNFVTLLE